MEGYVNVDIRSGEAVDVVTDLRNLSFELNAFDVIYSCAVIEYFRRNEGFGLLRSWTTFLKPGGTIYLSTSDFDAITKQYLETKNLQELLGLLIGGQKYEYDWHGMVFNFDILKKALEKLGYKDIKRYDWWEFEPCRI